MYMRHKQEIGSLTKAIEETASDPLAHGLHLPLSVSLCTLLHSHRCMLVPRMRRHAPAYFRWLAQLASLLIVPASALHQPTARQECSRQSGYWPPCFRHHSATAAFC
ncbi:hypothetical protein C0Q70_16115 [Pomacea canaliculata]|uniref:Uncharacterized protein n=1 Tax=Pomacea canaliculata TaxID=400727 RepID=A0A2T7NNX9_POMCA|nr:hypothetical protein C0Q70_16115 [Pomacea canaliculata]